ncbi:glycerate kinase [Echinicola sp. 20G]|uniref:glycerate kinase family protein n=1 Tax=Echinicola sp. 20G TaxID=2781961 RepID=UPI001911033D|nr:glycerate kinase [Echinicola sp. 20G]
MKFLIAPNAFKGTIPAEQAAQLIKAQLLKDFPENDLITSPIADGGDGTCALLASAKGMKVVEVSALNAIGKPKPGKLYLDNGNATARIDISEVSGLQGLELTEIDAKLSSSYGTGELILEAISQGAKHIVLGLGGSATVDMGTGILRALGFIFLDQNGREIPLFSTGFLGKIAHIQSPLKKYQIQFTCLCDVNNTFLGEKGAIPVFGPQKGLATEELFPFEVGAKRVFQLLNKKSGGGLKDREGFGAAGGIALGLSAFFPVEIKEGAKFFFDQVKMEQKVREADIIITGEGKFDQQSAGGKGSFELLQLAKEMGKKCFLITSGDAEEAKDAGFEKVIVLPDLDFKKSDFKRMAIDNFKKALDGHKWKSWT